MGSQEAEGGAGQAGKDPGEHMLEVEITLDELADILGEELELPAIENKGKSRIVAAKDRYTGVRRVGPESLRHFKRTYKEALKRSIAGGIYDPLMPLVVPQREDRRYRSWKEDFEPIANAVIIYMMDVSGSMGDEQKEIVRIESFWIDTWLRRQYQGLESRYIIHDAVAREVDRDTFFRTRESGGTMISSAYRLAARMMVDGRYPNLHRNSESRGLAEGQHVRVRTGRKSVRIGPVHQRPARTFLLRGAGGYQRDPRSRRDREQHQGLSGQGEVSRCRNSPPKRPSRDTCKNIRKRSKK
jgi:hypothetical protein